MTKLYAVHRVGIIIRDLFGVYSTLTKARSAAKRAQALEKDEYHDFEIHRYSLDTDVKTEKCTCMSPDYEAKEIKL